MGTEKGKREKGPWGRHTLLWLTERGRQYGLSHVCIQPWEEHVRKAGEAWQRELLLDPRIPAIFCGQTERRDGYWQAGFSHFCYQDGSRLRVRVWIPEEEITKAASPFAICGKERQEELFAAFPDLRRVWQAAGERGLTLGLYGSTALEWVTGYPYRNENSDYDVYARPGADADLAGFGADISRLEEDGIRLDVEVEIEGYGVKLKEWNSCRKTFLGKGLFDVKLFKKRDFL